MENDDDCVEVSLERRLARLETLVWVLCAINLPEVLALSELITS